jgi:hypothetical protein
MQPPRPRHPGGSQSRAGRWQCPRRCSMTRMSARLMLVWMSSMTTSASGVSPSDTDSDHLVSLHGLLCPGGLGRLMSLLPHVASISPAGTRTAFLSSLDVMGSVEICSGWVLFKIFPCWIKESHRPGPFSSMSREPVAVGSDNGKHTGEAVYDRDLFPKGGHRGSEIYKPARRSRRPYLKLSVRSGRCGRRSPFSMTPHCQPKRSPSLFQPDQNRARSVSRDSNGYRPSLATSMPTAAAPCHNRSQAQGAYTIGTSPEGTDNKNTSINRKGPPTPQTLRPQLTAPTTPATPSAYALSASCAKMFSSVSVRNKHARGLRVQGEDGVPVPEQALRQGADDAVPGAARVGEVSA